MQKYLKVQCHWRPLEAGSNPVIQSLNLGPLISVLVAILESIAPLIKFEDLQLTAPTGSGFTLTSQQP